MKIRQVEIDRGTLYIGSIKDFEAAGAGHSFLFRIPFEECRDRIFLRAYNQGQGLPLMPAVEVAGSIRVSAYADFSDVCGGAFPFVTGEVLDFWDMPFGEVLETAYGNMARAFSCCPLSDVLREFVPECLLPGGEEAPVKVLRCGTFGAGALAMPGLLKEALPEGEHYVLPSSVYELLAVPASLMGAQEAAEKVALVNASEVAPEDQLMDGAFLFRDGELSLASMAGAAPEDGGDPDALLRKLTLGISEGLRDAVSRAGFRCGRIATGTDTIFFSADGQEFILTLEEDGSMPAAEAGDGPDAGKQGPEGATPSGKGSAGGNTEVQYLNRDCSNCEKWSRHVLPGTLTDAEKEEIRGCLMCGKLFFPGQVGLPDDNRFSGTEDDEDWFEFVSLADTDRAPDRTLTAQELLENFREAKWNWEPPLG